MNLEKLLDQITTNPQSVDFSSIIETIDATYAFTPCAFDNGDLHNEAGQNSGSCKIFAFGLLNKLTEQQTLACFGHYYRDDVLANPQGDDHGNIRNFMQTGWSGIKFDGQALKSK